MLVYYSTRKAGKLSTDWNAKPPSRSGAVSGVLASHMITKSPIAIIILLPMACGVYKPLMQRRSNKNRSIDCAMCVRGMCSIEL